MPSFDIVSRVNLMEVKNAVQQAKKEIDTRYDFRGTGTTLEETEEGIVLRSSSEGRVTAALDVLQSKLIKRGVSMKQIDPRPQEKAGGDTVRQLVALKQGIPVEKARQIVQIVKDLKIKVQGSIQGDAVRVSGKSRDDLQSCIQAVRPQADALGLELQFTNFRD
jgi:hypothetical protein